MVVSIKLISFTVTLTCLIKSIGMSLVKTQKENLIDYLIENYKAGNQDWKATGRLFGFEAEQARKIWLNYRKQNNIGHLTTETQIQDNDTTTRLVNQQEDFKTGNSEVTVTSATEIKDLEDLSSVIDLEKWQISKYVQNYWNGKWQVKAWLEPKKPRESEIIEELLANYQSSWTGVTNAQKIINPTWTDDSLLVINLNDLHFDKRDMENNTIETNIKNYEVVLENLVQRAYHSAKIEKILFVVGNDLFNTDNIHDQTTNGTPQRCNTTWNDAYEKVFDTMVKSIKFLSSFSESGVHVVLVQGNHDRTKSYYLAHGLEAYFKNDPSVTFDRSANINKSYVYGNTFLGFNHGNNLNDKLPLAFAQEFYSEWGQCKYHDILISDKHNNNEKVFKVQTQNDGNQGVKLRILPSLSKPDRWHDDNLYRSRQSGIALLYDKQRGKSAEFEYQL